MEKPTSSDVRLPGYGVLTLKSLFADIPADLPDELFTTLVEESGVRIERIVSRGHSSPPSGWYDQADREWVMVVSGRAVIAYPDKPAITLEAGDCVTIAAHERHRVDWTSPDEDTVWLAVHYQTNETQGIPECG